MAHVLQDQRIQRSFQRQYDALLTELGLRADQRVLDIGSGVGFLKPMVAARGASYTGIEPDKSAFAAASALYGPQGYLCGFFPQAAPQDRYDLILVLSCVDEVPDRSSFLQGLRARLTPGSGLAYIAVRNRSFFVNRLKTERAMAGRSERSRISLSDLTDAQWQALLANCGLQVVECGKFWRPWFTGFSSTGARNVLYRLVSHVVPRPHSYMLYYKVRALPPAAAP